MASKTKAVAKKGPTPNRASLSESAYPNSDEELARLAEFGIDKRMADMSLAWDMLGPTTLSTSSRILRWIDSILWSVAKCKVEREEAADKACRPPSKQRVDEVWRALVDEFVVDLKARCETGEWSTEDERKRRERKMREDEEKHAKEEEKRQKREREVRARKEAEERAEEEAERNLDSDVRAIRSYLSRPPFLGESSFDNKDKVRAGRWPLVVGCSPLAAVCSPLAPRASSRLVLARTSSFFVSDGR